MAIESDIEGTVVKWAKLHDILPLKMTPASDSGWPDHLWLFYYPCMSFVEFKAPGATTKPRQKVKQELHRAELARRGFPVKVIDNVAEGIAFLEDTLLSRASSEARHIASVRGFLDVARYGKDNGLLRDLQDTKG